MTLGDKLRDGITGFSGVATARTEQFNGSVQFMLHPIERQPNGATIAPEWFDETRLEPLPEIIDGGQPQ